MVSGRSVGGRGGRVTVEFMRLRTRGRWTVVPTVVATSVVFLLLAYLNKARCAAWPFGTSGFREDGRTVFFDSIKDSQVCYSDVQHLWLGREINDHVFPFLTGGITPDGVLFGGTVEYPVLSGLLMWIAAIPSSNDAQFLLWSAVLMAPFGVLTAWLLGRMAGWPAKLWAAGPPLVMYAFHNWELPVVACAVGAIGVMALLPNMPLRHRSVLASVILAIGFCLKIYPGLFVAPLALYVLARGDLPARIGARRSAGSPKDVPGGYDVRGALRVVGAAVLTVVVINLPFAVFGREGWLASFDFQSRREADITTNSIWYWGLRSYMVSTGWNDDKEALYNNLVSVLSPLLLVLALALALWLGWRRRAVLGYYPWISVSAMMLCSFLLLHKVHSPQYTLWLVPFLVLLRVPWVLVGLYLIADLAMGIGVFRYFAAIGTGDYATEVDFVLVGVWGRAALLVIFFVIFARVGLRREPEPADEPGPDSGRRGSDYTTLSG